MSGNEQLNVTTKSWDIIASRVYSGVNANLTLEASGPTANLLIKTNGNVIVTAGPTGNVTFTKPPICSVLPVVDAHLVNKQYADSLIGSGAQGPQGAQGVVGAQGSQGFTGAQGLSGPKGFTGSVGSKGADGSVGTQGDRGSQGATGTQGSEGSQGPKGSQGSTGSQGSRGSQGETGAQGTQGYNGAVGARGTTLTLTSGNNISLSQTPDPQTATINLTSSLGPVTSQIYTTYLNTSNIYFSNSVGGPTWVSGGVNKYFFYNSSPGFYLNDYLKIPLNTVGSGGSAIRGTEAGTALFYVLSSEKYKTNIQRLPDNDDILNIRPVSYNYKDADGNPVGKVRIGFIAEEMAKNERGNYFVYRDASGNIETINYELLAPLYASAIICLKKKLTNLISDLEILKENQKIKISDYEQRITLLENLK